MLGCFSLAGRCPQPSCQGGGQNQSGLGGRPSWASLQGGVLWLLSPWDRMGPTCTISESRAPPSLCLLLHQLLTLGLGRRP